MILMNSSFFTPEKLGANGTEVYIGSRLIRDGTENKMEIRCGTTIKTIYPGRNGGPETTYTCSLARK